MPRFTCCIKEPTDCSESAAGTISFSRHALEEVRECHCEHDSQSSMNERGASAGTRTSNTDGAEQSPDDDSLIVLALDVRKLRSCAPLKLPYSKSSRLRCNCGSFRCLPSLRLGRHWCGRKWPVFAARMCTCGKASFR